VFQMADLPAYERVRRGETDKRDLKKKGLPYWKGFSWGEGGGRELNEFALWPFLKQAIKKKKRRGKRLKPTYRQKTDTESDHLKLRQNNEGKKERRIKTRLERLAQDLAGGGKDDTITSRHNRRAKILSLMGKKGRKKPTGQALIRARKGSVAITKIQKQEPRTPVLVTEICKPRRGSGRQYSTGQQNAP